MPQASHPDYGILRAIVKDSTDKATGLAAEEYLDSGW